MDCKEKLICTGKLVEEALAKYMDIGDLPQKRVFDAMSYSLLAGGKRLRPIIMIYACEM